jgi:NAD(P)-dependent dehydrogenase (short-subunit alcohol dehydrogenase family)
MNLDLQIENKKAVITGASRGIGKATARRLALEGCDLVICARSDGPLQATAAELSAETGRKVIGITCDTMDDGSIRRFIAEASQQLGGIDILVNSAARVGGAPGTIETVLDTDVLKDFEEKVVGYLRCSREAIPHMKQAGWGRIINVSGGAGRNPNTAVSGGVRNTGVINLTKSMANTLGPFGINVNAIYPGQTVTEVSLERLAEQSRRENRSVDAILAEQAQATLLRHLVTAEDIANVVAFLCSPLSVSITGEAIAVNGGTSSDVHY